MVSKILCKSEKYDTLCLFQVIDEKQNFFWIRYISSYLKQYQEMN